MPLGPVCWHITHRKESSVMVTNIIDSRRKPCWAERGCWVLKGRQLLKSRQLQGASERERHLEGWLLESKINPFLCSPHYGRQEENVSGRDPRSLTYNWLLHLLERNTKNGDESENHLSPGGTWRTCTATERCLVRCHELRGETRTKWMSLRCNNEKEQLSHAYTWDRWKQPLLQFVLMY